MTFSYVNKVFVSNHNCLFCIIILLPILYYHHCLWNLLLIIKEWNTWTWGACCFKFLGEGVAVGEIRKDLLRPISRGNYYCCHRRKNQTFSPFRSDLKYRSHLIKCNQLSVYSSLNLSSVLEFPICNIGE